MTMGIIAGLTLFIGLIAGAVGLFRIIIPKVGGITRGKAALICCFALAMIVAGGILAPLPSPEVVADREAKRIQREQERELEQERLAQEKIVQDSTCRQDLQCWGDKHILRVTFACEPLIENLALYDYEWTDGFLGAKFDRLRWKKKPTGELQYLGDSIKFQNAFGAWKHMSYTCDYDPDNEVASNARVFDGYK